jgi:predicted nucleic acid-binding protein
MSDVSISVGRKVCLDTNILIYLIEGHSAFSSVVARLFEAIDAEKIEAVTSELSIAEVLVKPIAERKQAIVDAYSAVLAPGSRIDLRPIDRSTLRLSAETRVELGGRAFDAINVATAILAGCTSFMTNDDRIRAPASLRLARLSDLGGSDDAVDAS